MNDHFCIDLDRKNPEVMIYPAEAIQEDLDYFGGRDPLKLGDYDRKVFRTEKEACAWLRRYLKVLKSLNNKHICKSRKLPAMLLKRRYLVQTIMGEKVQTYRKYRRDWPPGQFFNFHDETFFLTVRLKKISTKKDADGQYRYDFELP